MLAWIYASNNRVCPTPVGHWSSRRRLRLLKGLLSAPAAVHLPYSLAISAEMAWRWRRRHRLLSG